MREYFQVQKKLGEINIADIKISNSSRDDIPNVLKGLQYVWVQTKLRDRLLSKLALLLTDSQIHLGRQGMNLWCIFVLGVLRVSLNWDYDRLAEMAAKHSDIRQMLGYGFFDAHSYSLQTLKDNVKLLTPELLYELNTEIVKAGHKLVQKGDLNLHGRCDSFVVETNVHFPTDISLLYDALNSAIRLTALVCRNNNVPGWRQYSYNIKTIKRACRKAQQSKRGIVQRKEHRIIDAHSTYIKLATDYIVKIVATLLRLPDSVACDQIKSLLNHATRQIDQINRRVINGEVIPSLEKVYSIHQPHTEWINKGKPGGQIELGLKVCVLEDQHQFILGYRVMENECDADIAGLIVKKTQKNFSSLSSCSFDKGFYSDKNEKELATLLDRVVMAKKGKLSKKRHEYEHEEQFIKDRHQHSAVESAINCLEHHGLDRCLDNGIDGFKRYVALAIAGKNLHRIGAIIRAQERKIEHREKVKLLAA